MKTMFDNYNGHELIIMMRKHATMREEEKATNNLSERNCDFLCVDGQNYSLHPCLLAHKAQHPPSSPSQAGSLRAG